MVVGLPISGIGGLFYLLMALWMPVREFALLLQGRSSLARWGFIGRQLALFSGVVVGIWGQCALTAYLLPDLSKKADEATGMAALNEAAAGQTLGLVAGSTVLAATTLASVALVVYAGSLSLHLRARLRGTLAGA